MKSKKGAIELSMTTIIVIVLGVTLLILGLAFVRGIFDKITPITEEAFSSAEKEVQQRMGASDRIYVSGGVRWVLDPGKAAVRSVGIRNFDDNAAAMNTFKIEVVSEDTKVKKEWFMVTQPGKIESGKQKVAPMEIRLPSNLPPGSSYSMTVRVLKDNVEYDSQGIILAIKE